MVIASPVEAEPSRRVCEAPRLVPANMGRRVELDAVPQPYRALLGHDGSMTATLARHHDSALRLDVLHWVMQDDRLDRAVVLRRQRDGVPVEYGALSLTPSVFPPSLQADIEAGRVPFGRLLHSHGVSFIGRPTAFFAVDAPPSIGEALAVRPGTRLWGRESGLWSPGGQCLARVVEVLAPA